MNITEEQRKILIKYDIDINEYKDINDLLDTLNDEMIKYVDEDDEPLPEFLELEKVYDQIYYQNTNS